MLDLDDLFDISSGKPLSRRGQRLVRLVFGGLVAAMCIAGAWQIVAAADGGLHLRVAFAGFLLAIALFGVAGIGLGWQVKRLGKLCIWAFVAVFAIRILFGA